MRTVVAWVVALSGLVGLRAEAAPPPHFAGWDGAWAKARACLVGEPQAGADLATAFTLAEILRPPTSCAAVVNAARDLARAGDADPGFRLAWYRIAKGFVELSVHEREIDPTSDDSRIEAAPLVARAVEQIDAADRQLREFAGIPVPTRAAPLPAPPELKLDRVFPGTERLNTVLSRSNGIEGAQIDVMVPDLGSLSIEAPNRMHWWGTPKRRWGGAIRANGAQVVVGAIGANGEVEGTTAVVMRGKALEVIATLEDGAARALVVTSGDADMIPTYLVKSADGTKWDVPVLLGTMRARVRDNAVHLFSFVAQPDDVRWDRVTGAGTVARARQLSSKTFELARTCIVDDVLWWTHDGRSFVADERGTRELGKAKSILACTAKRAAYYIDGQIVACTLDRCEAAQRKHAPGEIALDDTIGYVTATQRGSLLVVGKDFGDPKARTGNVKGTAHRAFRIGDSTILAGVAVWQGKIYVALFERERGLGVVAVP